MKKTIILILTLSICLLFGCANQPPKAEVVATTKPVYDFSVFLCQNTDIQVSLLVTENLSCLHDYTLQVRQMQAVEGAQLVIINGAGLEEFLEDVLQGKDFIIDASQGISVLCGDHDHEDGDHHHQQDAHIWLSVANAKQMAQNISDGLCAQFPQHKQAIAQNLIVLNEKFDQLEAYGKANLSHLQTRNLITFHDGFSYFAQYWDLTILHSLEEESGSEASAAELKDLIEIVRTNNVPAIFVEENGSTSASKVVSAETGVKIFTLNMAMGEQDYFESMYQNINNIKEALG